MKKYRGYTYINTVFILAVVLIIVFYIVDNNSVLINTYSNEIDSINSSYKAESIINIIFSKQENLVKNMEKVYFYEDEINLSIDETLIKDLNNQEILLSKKDENFIITVNVDYKNIKSYANAYGSIVNEIYTKGFNTINEHTISLDELNSLKNSYSNFLEKSGNDERIINLLEDTYFIKKGKKKNEIYKLINEEEFLVKSFRDEERVLINQVSGNLVVEDNVNIKGIINADNIILLNDLNLNGLLNLNSEVITENNLININGILINLYNIRDDNIKIKYDFKSIKDISEYIPEYIKPKLFNIKKG